MVAHRTRLVEIFAQVVMVVQVVVRHQVARQELQQVDKEIMAVVLAQLIHQYLLAVAVVTITVLR